MDQEFPSGDGEEAILEEALGSEQLGFQLVGTCSMPETSTSFPVCSSVLGQEKLVSKLQCLLHSVGLTCRYLSSTVSQLTPILLLL